jgi:protein-S-isoprenylcysteine O-methyltransferase Ste14
MNDDLIFRVILAILFVLVVGTRRYFEQKAAKTTKEELKQDIDSRALIVIPSLLLTLSNIAIIAYLIKPSWMAWSSVMIPEWARWMGAALGVAGSALLVWAHRILGKNFFGGTKIRQGHQLITEGPYRWVRHPMYTAFILLGLAWFLLSENWLIGGFWLAATIMVIFTRLNAEERMLLQEFGDTYRNYARRTGRFLPKLRSKATSTDFRT